MTDYQRRKVIEALTETQRLLAKESRYLPHLQKPDQIARYQRHIAKLLGYLVTDRLPNA